MTNRRGTVAGLLAASLVTLAMSACSSVAVAPGATKSGTRAIQIMPKQTLLDTAKEIGQDNVKFTLTDDGATAGGVAHLRSSSARMTTTVRDLPRGRLTELTIKLSDVGETKAHELKITYTRYGTAWALPSVAGETQDAHADPYQMFKWIRCCGAAGRPPTTTSAAPGHRRVSGLT